ncbi:IMV membrane [Tanapox virus]|uniref:IMV membrane n=2 Tax=Tanapox virus TaxID=99000 RepID=A7XCQ3_9POXV|nr:120L protein [Yaba-like disease virus]ABQ43595.1 IMV membrane [Tanapox virus]ABQ43750.1 IMV membrane [Tanapox virus]CAC21358.1 120L protein [Yaba-like disease virus]
MSEEDINESNFNHLLVNLSNNSEVDGEFSATLMTIKEIISQINFKILAINKKSKKNLRPNDITTSYVSKRENVRY